MKFLLFYVAQQMLIRYISHEVRTPMNTIFLGLKLLQKEIHNYSSDVLLDVIKDLKSSATTALFTLNDMLAFDKILRNSLEVEVEKVRPWPLLREVIAPMLVQVLISCRCICCWTMLSDGVP